MQNTSFSHSVKVPKLYKCAARISQEVAGGSASIKQLVYEKQHFNTKALYALVVTTFQKVKEIDLLLKRTKLLEKEPRLDPWLAKILISEVLWGKKQLPKSEAKPIQTILAYEQAFHAHLSDTSEDATTAVKPESCKKPRYVRINTIANPFNEALELFQDEGWILKTPNDQNSYESFLEQVANLEGDFMLKDLHIPDLLIFPGGTEFYNHPGYKKGVLVLQDKASCIPVHLLSPPPGSVVLDMCAAPGMKTTQLAAMLQNEGILYAVERDQKRFAVLNKMVESSGATCVRTINKDVLQCGDLDFPDVEYILVDPSCSASGMIERVEFQQNRDQQRLQKLAGFQIKILRSAFTRYPRVKKVVYSTCSLYPEENEDVVRQVLETNNQFKLVPADQFLHKAWRNYGSSDFGDIGKYCLYARPEEDLTNGFFVAVFERLEEGENNQFFNGRVLNFRKNVEQKQARRERKYREKYEGESNKGKEDKEEEICDEQEANAEDHLNENRKHKRNDVNADVDTENQSLGNASVDEVAKKKKKKKKHGAVENGIHTADEDNKELIKKNKTKKRKHNEDYEDPNQAKETDVVADDRLSEGHMEASEDKSSSKGRKKERKQNLIDYDEADNYGLSRKRKTKKNEGSVDEKLDVSSKKSKKKKEKLLNVE